MSGHPYATPGLPYATPVCNCFNGGLALQPFYRGCSSSAAENSFRSEGLTLTEHAPSGCNLRHDEER